MAHYAKIEDGIVTDVIVVGDGDVDADDETAVSEFLAACGLPGEWLRCSYNTFMGKHRLDGEPFRGTYPGIGYAYDAELDIFVRTPRPTPDATFDTETYDWIIPDGEE